MSFVFNICICFCTLLVKGDKREEIVMGFWCLSSDVIFKPIASQARAIILTSGTLSPVNKQFCVYSLNCVDGYFCFRVTHKIPFTIGS